MELIGFVSIVAVAVALGVAVQYFAKSDLTNEWLIVAIAFTFGAYFSSESFPGSTVFSGIQDWGPEFYGVLMIPAVVGGAVLAFVADLGMRTIPQARTA